MTRWLPKRIGAQIAMLLVAATVLTHLLFSAVFFLTQHGHAAPDIPAGLAKALDAEANPEASARILAAFQSMFPRMEIRVEPAQAAAGAPADDLRVIALADGRRLIVRDILGPPRGIGPILATALFLAASIVAVVLWAARQLVAPLRAFAEAAERFDPLGSTNDLPLAGPQEIVVAARAFNHMRERIRKLIDERTRMLTNIGHDLRTPLTRLRLRSELVSGETGERLQRDVTQMSAMVDHALRFLARDEAVEFVKIDLPATLESLRDDFADLGHRVDYRGPDHMEMHASPQDLERAVSNLLDNATKYGKHAAIELRADASSLVIAVVDDGPGIDEGDWERLLEPFARGDPARNEDGIAGFGLGLAIARTVAERHGGRLETGRAADGRFEIGMRLPRSRSPADRAGSDEGRRAPAA